MKYIMTVAVYKKISEDQVFTNVEQNRGLVVVSVADGDMSEFLERTLKRFKLYVSEEVKLKVVTEGL